MTAYDAATALLVVDVQNDFADPEGNLYVAEGDEIVPRVNEEIRTARRAGATVVYTQDAHPSSTPHFEKDGGTWPVHCVDGTWGAELHPSLAPPADGDPLIRKGTGGEDGYSAFSVRDPESGEEEATELDRILGERGVERVTVIGLAQDVCVKETALDALRLGYGTTVLTEATRPVNLSPGDGEAALDAIRAAGGEVR